MRAGSTILLTAISVISSGCRPARRDGSGNTLANLGHVSAMDMRDESRSVLSGGHDFLVVPKYTFLTVGFSR